MTSGSAPAPVPLKLSKCPLRSCYPCVSVALGRKPWVEFSVKRAYALAAHCFLNVHSWDRDELYKPPLYAGKVSNPSRTRAYYTLFTRSDHCERGQKMTSNPLPMTTLLTLRPIV